eukprot:414152-Pelagomonas_calceolata.AAC.5
MLMATDAPLSESHGRHWMLGSVQGLIALHMQTSAIAALHNLGTRGGEGMRESAHCVAQCVLTRLEPCVQPP